MKTIKIFLISLFLIVGIISSVCAITDPVIFPKNAQSDEQQKIDTERCESWAKNKTQIDPAYLKAKIEMLDEQIVSASASSGPSTGGRLLRGAARGAALGGVGDAIDNNVGKRAAQGAMLAGMNSRDQRQQQQAQGMLQSKANQRQQYEEQYNTYIRSFSACMDGKGYSVR